MNLTFLNTLTDAQRAALAILAEDLHNFGVTDSLGQTPIGLQNFVKAEPVPAKPAAAPLSAITAAKPISQPMPQPKVQRQGVTHVSGPVAAAKHSAQPFVLDDHLQIIPGELPFAVVMSATNGHSQWDGAEQTLWHNMMRAMGFEGQNPTFMLLKGAAAADAPLPSNHEASLRGVMLDKLPKQPVLVLGHRGLQILSAGEANAAAIRRGDWQLKLPENSQKDSQDEKNSIQKGCYLACVATYHPHTLLRQPFLKRQTWADLLTLKQVLEEGTV